MFQTATPTTGKQVTNHDTFQIRLYGTRGSLSCPGEPFARAGGNTTCVLVTCGKRQIIIDGGSGIKQLGHEMINELAQNPGEDADRLCKLDILLSHAHYDHVEGLPLFRPFYNANFHIDLHCGALEGAETPSTILPRLMQPPFFPIGPDCFEATIQYHLLGQDQEIDAGDNIRIITAPLNHPGGANGFRIEYKGKSFAFVSDTTHVPGEPDENVLNLMKDCDLCLYDATFIDKEFPQYCTHGHSTWEELVRLTELSGAKAALASHHSPFRNDDQLDAIEAHMKKLCPRISAAREGQQFELL